MFRPTVTFRGPVDGAAAALATRCEVPMRSIHHCVPGSVISVAASTRIVHAFRPTRRQTATQLSGEGFALSARPWPMPYRFCCQRLRDQLVLRERSWSRIPAETRFTCVVVVVAELAL